MGLSKYKEQEQVENNKEQGGFRKRFLGIIDREVIFWGALITVGCIFVLVWLALFGNSDQPYNDIVIETLARFATNKTIEVQLIYAVVFGGSILCLLWHFFGAEEDPHATKRDPITEPLGFCVCGILVLLIGRYVSYGRPHQLLLALLGVGLLYRLFRHFFGKELLLPALCFAFSGYYGIIGGYRLYVFAGGTKNFSVIYAIVATFVLMVGISLIRGDRRKHIGRAILLAQLFLPCLFLYLLQDKYRQGAKLFIVEAPLPVKIFVAVVVAACLSEAVLKLRRRWKNPAEPEGLIALGSCVAIVCFNCFFGSGAILPWDMYHPYDNAIGFQQIFQLGQIPYEDYYPVTGMYSVIMGAFLHFFGNDLFSNYFVCLNVFLSSLGIITVLLLGQRLRRPYLLFISTYLSINGPHGSFLVGPILMLLSWPYLIDKKRVWLQAWLFIGFLHGLYYPTQGAAVGVGFLPLALWQGYTYVKSGQLREDRKRLGFYCSWALCLLPIIVSAPVLIGAARHSLTRAAEALLSDGMTRFAQGVPDFFLPYVTNHPVIRSAYNLTITFLIPGLFVWVALYLALKVGKVRLEGRRLHIENMQDFCTCLVLVIMPPIVYGFSAIRMDAGDPFNKHGLNLAVGAVMLIVMAYRCVEKKRLFYAICCFAFLIPTFMRFSPGFLQLGGGKLNHCYYVARNYVYVQNDRVSRIGNGFMRSNEYKQAQKFWQQTRTMDRGKSYLSLFPHHGYNYLLNIKGAGPIGISATIRGYDITCELVEEVRAKKAVVGTYYNPIQNYYFHNWLLTSGEYYYDEETNVYLYNDGKYKRSEVLALNKKMSNRGFNGAYLYSYASALGSSMASLEPIFSEPPIEMQVVSEGKQLRYDLSREIVGEEADFIYLEFIDQFIKPQQVLYNYYKWRWEPQGAGPVYKYLTKTHYNWGRYVTVNWVDDEGKQYKQRCEMHKGKLLIPLGAGGGWLLNKHRSLTVTADDWGKAIEVPPIKEAKLLKVREVPRVQVGDEL